jgi:hypothetical protein
MRNKSVHDYESVVFEALRGPIPKILPEPNHDRVLGPVQTGLFYPAFPKFITMEP